MNSIQVALADLISIDRRHKEYTLSDYIAYCNEIREAYMSLSNMLKGQGKKLDDKSMIDFFTKKFVEEMEVLARICKHQFGSNHSGVTVRYSRHDPPDGIITLTNGDKVFVECTTAVDRGWENFVLEQLEKYGRVISLSGFERSDIEGNRNRGYQVKGIDVDDPTMAEFLVVADEDTETIARQRKQIADKIEKKLDNEWQLGVNWLAIFVNEMIFPDNYSRMEPTLTELCLQYSGYLQEKHIKALYFIGNRCDDSAWMSFHPIEAKVTE